MDVWTSGNITLICGNSYRLIDNYRGIATAIIADPPYGISLSTNRRERGWSNLAECHDFAPIEGDDRPFDPAPFLGFPIVVLFGGNYFADKLPPSPGWIVWDKLHGLHGSREFGFCDMADVELIWTNIDRPARLVRHRWMGMIKDSEHTESRVHPTQKPIALMETLVRPCP